MKPLEFLNRVYIVNPRGVDPSLVEAAAGGLRDKATKQMVRQARPVGDILMKNPGPVVGVIVGGAAVLSATGVVVAKRKVIGEKAKREWERAQGKTSTPDADGRFYDPWRAASPKAEDGKPESATTPASALADAGARYFVSMANNDVEPGNVPSALRTTHESPEAGPHRAGTTVALRSVRPVVGRGPAVVFAVSGVVLHDDDDVTVVATRPGSAKAVRAGARGGPRGRNAVDAGWDGSYDLRVWEGETVVRVHRRGQCWSIWRWHDGRDWGRTWYGNLEAPWRRTAIGYDTQDWALDVVAEGVPDRADWTVGFKDEDELQWFVDQGVCSAAQADSIRHVGHTLAASLRHAGQAEVQDWDRWVPPLEVPPTPLPDGWDTPE